MWTGIISYCSIFNRFPILNGCFLLFGSGRSSLQGRVFGGLRTRPSRRQRGGLTGGLEGGFRDRGGARLLRWLHPHLELRNSSRPVSGPEDDQADGGVGEEIPCYGSREQELTNGTGIIAL
jgi:hypothetical protein